jgi:drug/metabolite transporter (DMT)-like permease
MIWGSTWMVIKFQLGVVPPAMSVAYRFLLAGVLLFIFCLIKGEKLKLDFKTHLRILTLGIFIFCTNYICTYYSTMYMASGLVSVVFAAITGMNIINSRIFLGEKVQKRVLMAALSGFLGIALVFAHDLKTLNLESATLIGLAYSAIGTLMASFGNMISVKNQKRGISIMVSNTYGMLYGGTCTFLFALAQGHLPTFDFRFNYIWSLFYLSILGSIVAFGAYFQLIKKVGPARAAYTAVLFPIVALFLSTLFENYKWDFTSLLGVVFILAGNVFILQNKKKAPKT